MIIRCYIKGDNNIVRGATPSGEKKEDVHIWLDTQSGILYHKEKSQVKSYHINNIPGNSRCDVLYFNEVEIVKIEDILGIENKINNKKTAREKCH